MNPLTKKLLMKPRQRWLLLHAPATYPSTLLPLPTGLVLSYKAEGEYDGIQIFVKNSKELKRSLKSIKSLLFPNIILWITYPKKSSGVETDLTMMSSWDELSKYELGGVSAAAIDENWTALRFRSQQLIRKEPTQNNEMGNAHYTGLVDLKNRIVILPSIAEQVLMAHPTALQFFNALSFTNKKEYVLWIITAKREKTREDRLQKMVQKLAAGKKNPSER